MSEGGGGGEGRRLGDVASILRSKIAGPYLLSLEAFFVDAATATAVERSGAISVDAIAGAYGVRPEDVRSITWYSMFPAVKCVLWPLIPADSPRCRDVYGSQSHIPFSELLIPEPPR